MSTPFAPPEITPTILLRAYANGIFPMSEAADADEVFWVDPKSRGIIPLDGLHVSRSTARFVRSGSFTVTVDTCFDDVVSACAERNETWINGEIADLYGTLHRLGYAHSVEVWDGAQLFGGLYGVSIGGAFFGESMFSRATNGSKIALIWLVARLRAGGYALLDTQFVTDHLVSLGAIEITRSDYHRRLTHALHLDASFFALPSGLSHSEILQRSTQMS